KSPQYPTALYTQVRERFLWFDAAGNDQLFPLLQQLAAEGICQLEKSRDQQHDLIRMTEPVAPAVPPKDEPPADQPDAPPVDEFRLLNALEEREKREINFGAYETAHTVGQVAALVGRSAAEASSSLARLLEHGYLVCVGEGKYRSRMAEMARLVR